MKTAIVGGGAAGFFAAVNLKEMMPDMQVVILERSQRVLHKVTLSGGGRCNLTNSFRMVDDLQWVYPRGHRLMKRLLRTFSHDDAYRWFEQHGVPLVTQPDECVFPKAQDSRAITQCLTSLARRYGVTVRTAQPIDSLQQLADYDFVLVATGGQPRAKGLQWLCDAGHDIAEPVPSLFTFCIADEALRSLMGLVAEEAAVGICGTKMRAEGPLLVTHWGMSGPAILKLSSYGARWLAEHDYRCQISVNWTGHHETEIMEELQRMQGAHRMKQLQTPCAWQFPCQDSTQPYVMPTRLWSHLLNRALGEKAGLRWVDIGRKDLNRLASTIAADVYDVSGKAPQRDEFVTCGGIALDNVSSQTLESKRQPGLFFAGELLDIDGITGGFNLQAAWTTAYVAAKAIAAAAEKKKLEFGR